MIWAAKIEMKNVWPGQEDKRSTTPADRKRKLSLMKRKVAMNLLSACSHGKKRAGWRQYFGSLFCGRQLLGRLPDQRDSLSAPRLATHATAKRLFEVMAKD
jgi:hypothetical protein